MIPTQNDIRGVLIAVGGGRILLPNANVAEVISYSEPERVAVHRSGCSAQRAGAVGGCRC